MYGFNSPYLKVLTMKSVWCKFGEDKKDEEQSHVRDACSFCLDRYGVNLLYALPVFSCWNVLEHSII